MAWGTFASKAYNQTETEAKGYWCMPIQCMETKEKWHGQKHVVHFKWLTCAQSQVGVSQQVYKTLQPFANKTKDPLLFPVSCSAVFVFINYSGYVACSKKHVFHELGIYMARCRDTAELQNYNIQLSIQPLHCKKRFVIWTIVFLTRIATVDMVLWDDTRIVPCDSQLWAIQCTWSSYRNNWMLG